MLLLRRGGILPTELQGTGVMHPSRKLRQYASEQATARGAWEPIVKRLRRQLRRAGNILTAGAKSETRRVLYWLLYTPSVIN